MLSSRQPRGATWPFLLVLALLFALCVTAPRAWDHQQPRPGIDLAVQSPKASSVATLAPAAHRVVAPADATTSPAEEPTLASPADFRPSVPSTATPAAPVPVAEEPAGLIAREVFPPLAPRTAARPDPVSNEPPWDDATIFDEPSGLTFQMPRWPEPVELLARLQRLACQCECCTWALRVERLVRQWIDEPTLDTEARIGVMDALQDLEAEADGLAEQIGDGPLKTELRRAQHALARRLGIWRRLAQMDISQSPAPAVRPRQALMLAVADVEEMLSADHAAAKSWREFVCLDAVGALAAQQAAADAEQRDLVSRVLERLNRRDLSPSQRKLVASSPLAELQSQLRYWVDGNVDPHELMAQLEAFEQTTLPGDARTLSAIARQMTWSADPDQQVMGQWMERHYRNANFRVAISGELLSQLMPEIHPAGARVDETILGVPVDGHSLTTTHLSVIPVPSGGKLIVDLAARGTISSRTRSDSGLAVLHNQGRAVYLARKRLRLGLGGVTTQPTVAAVDSQSELSSVDTDFDELPVIGYLFQEIVRSEYSQNADRARREQETKIDARVREEIDRLADERLQEANHRYQQRVLVPLERLSLRPEMIEAESTDQRVIARIRLASEDQLGSHTPRPVAPSDSLLSAQFHQSALNNLLEGLDLDSGTYTLAELKQRVAHRLNRPQTAEHDESDEEVTIRFADRDAVRARFVDNTIELTVSLAEMTTSAHRWTDFAVRVFYRPSSTSLDSELVRDGSIQLIGPNVRGPQIALRGIFTGVFSTDEPWPLLPAVVRERLGGEHLEITQCLIEDGWFALAVGPYHQIQRQTRAAMTTRR